MKKLRLSLEDIRVSSFSVQHESGGGTVKALNGEATLFGMGNTCDGTCYQLCVENGGTIVCGGYQTAMTFCDQRGSCVPRQTCGMSCQDYITECGASCNADCSFVGCQITSPYC